MQLDKVLNTLASHSPTGAQHVRHRIRAVIDLLAQHPNIGRRTMRREMRRIVVSPYPYLIFYKVGRDEIVIHGIRHAARRPSR